MSLNPQMDINELFQGVSQSQVNQFGLVALAKLAASEQPGAGAVRNL